MKRTRGVSAWVLLAAGAFWLAGCSRGSAPPVQAPSAPGVLVTDGDSITAYNAYQPLLSLRKPFTIYNTAISGAILEQMETASFTSVDPLFSINAPNNIVIIWGGTNNFYFGEGLTATYDSLLKYCASRKARGFKVIVVTMLSRTGSGGNPVATMDSYKNQYNALLRAHWRGFADGLADVALIPEVGNDGAFTNTTYFTDGIHPAQAGYALIAKEISIAVNNLN